MADFIQFDNCTAIYTCKLSVSPVSSSAEYFCNASATSESKNFLRRVSQYAQRETRSQSWALTLPAAALSLTSKLVRRNSRRSGEEIGVLTDEGLRIHQLI